MEDIALEKTGVFGRINPKGVKAMKRLAALCILLALLLAGCVDNDWEEFPSFPELTIPGITEEPLPSFITEPELT